MRTGHAYLLCGANAEAVEQVAQRLVGSCNDDRIDNRVVTIPAPLQQGKKRFHFAPSLIASGHVVRDGTTSFIAPVAETLECYPCSAVISQHDRAAIVGIWLVPPEWPVPVPQQIVADALAAVRGGSAYLLCGGNEETVNQAALRLTASLPVVVVTQENDLATRPAPREPVQAKPAQAANHERVSEPKRYDNNRLPGSATAAHAGYAYRRACRKPPRQPHDRELP